MIYVTNYQQVPMFKYLNKSVDSGFKSIDQVVQVMGSKFIQRGKRFVIYGDESKRAFFSDYEVN